MDLGRVKWWWWWLAASPLADEVSRESREGGGWITWARVGDIFDDVESLYSTGKG